MIATYEWNTRDYANGPHDIVVRAYDEWNEWGEKAFSIVAFNNDTTDVPSFPTILVLAIVGAGVAIIVVLVVLKKK